MPTRHQDFRERCDLCDAEADHVCLRCARPLCSTHAPANDRRCDRCESHLESVLSEFRRPIPAPRHLLAAVSVAICSVAAGLMIPGLYQAQVFVGLGAFAFVAISIGRGFRREHLLCDGLRRKFLDERPNLQLLPPPTQNQPPSNS